MTPNSDWSDCQWNLWFVSLREPAKHAYYVEWLPGKGERDR